MNYNFYGWEDANVQPVNDEFKDIKDPRKLYDILSEIWCEYTCAPRLRKLWSEDNKTLGQCSITAFLAQDIFGGKVYGILRSGGNYHCYNVVGDVVFDLTSEQFGDVVLDYSDNPEQFREVHFAKTEKFERYKYLKNALIEYLHCPSIPSKRPVSLEEMTKEEFNAKMERGIAQAKASEGVPSEEFFSDMEQQIK